MLHHIGISDNRKLENSFGMTPPENLMDLNLQKSPLGKQVSYKNSYSKELLHPIPRVKKYKTIKGEDLWNVYELSWLNMKGKPIIDTAEIRFSITSKNIIESKSLKLYLNALSQSRFMSSEEVCLLIQKDLQDIVEGHVKVEFSPKSFNVIADIDAVCIDEQNISIDQYELNPNILNNSVQNGVNVKEKLCTHLFKSNCPVTGQPDWASIIIEYRGPKIEHSKLLQYLVSYRQHQDFHEQCIERIFLDIKQYCKPTSLSIQGRFTRRGGLDINPFRSDQINHANNDRLVRQ